MIKNNYFSDNPDLVEHFNSIVDWKEIVEAYEGKDFEDARLYQETSDEAYATAPSSVEEAVAYYKEILNSAGDIAGNHLAQASKEIDKVGLVFKDGKVKFPAAQVDCVSKIREAGLIPYGFSRKFGGLGIPFVVKAFFNELFYRADVSTAITAFCVNLAEILEKYASKEMKEEWLPKFASGKYTISMGLTEPNYGSDLPNIITKAIKQPDGTWILNGTKRFITQACGFEGMDGVILTLARTGSATSGARGLSFFLVQSKDVQIASIESKMGMHASPTCEVVLENTPGLLIGEEGYGLSRYVIGMLNGARIGIAYEGTGVATAAYYEALKFAKERIQFGRAIVEIPAVKKILDRMERETLAMRCLSMEGSRMIDFYTWREERLKKKGASEKEINQNEDVRKWEKMATLFTPIAKYYCSEMCNKIAYDAIQIHGGSGYTEDYDVSRIYTDARVASIYDGTSQIQVMAAIGGIVSGMSKTGIFRKYLEEEFAKFSPSNEILEVRQILEDSVEKYKSIKESTAKDGMSDEVVDIAARLLCGMLLERNAARLDGEAKTRRLSIAKIYNIDSLAVCRGKLYKIGMAA